MSEKNNKNKEKENKKLNKNSKKDKQKIKVTIEKQNGMKPLAFLIVISIVIALISPYIYSGQKYIEKDIALNKLSENYNNWIYESIIIDGNKAIATLSGVTVEENGIIKEKREIATLPANDSLKDLDLNNPNITTKIEIKDNTSKQFWSEMLPTIIGFILFFVIAMLIIGRMWWVANNAMSFGRSRARLHDKEKDKVVFADVAGAEEEKQELQEIVDFLKSPQKYKKIWAKIPKWVLMVWPPGTGKTMLGRAVAWESDVPFFSISGSEFVEMFVWVGASRVRDLFDQAKKMAPSIIFIDEIDAIGKKRWPGLGGGHDEREQTLNQILTEMDWFDQDTNVIVMAATNRAEVLDNALLRPGRFDRKITVGLPNLEDREKILEVHSKNKPISKNVDFKSIASTTVWFSWADLGNLINEAAILTAKNNEKEITSKNVQLSFERIVMWITKKSQIMSEQEKKITAYHEVWHALVGKLLPNTDPVHKVSIISRWWALWVTWFLPERDRLLITKAKYKDELSTLYWWRVAEEIFFGKENITTWAGNDIERATDMARSMVVRYGMDDELWAENFTVDSDRNNSMGISNSYKPFSEQTQELIDVRVKIILKEAYETAKRLISENKTLHEKISEDLLKKEELTREEFSAYFS